jgi:hypothetical protein
MSRFSKLDVECAVPLSVRAQLTPAEMDAILEVAYLAIISDGILNEEEADAFVRTMLRLYGDEASAARIHAMMKRLSDRLERGDTCAGALCARAPALIGSLRRTLAREQAYKLAYVMAICDLRTNDAEFAFDQAIRETLGISQERAEELADEASAAVLGRGPHKPGQIPACACDAPPAASARSRKARPAVRAKAAKQRAASRSKPAKKLAAARSKPAGKRTTRSSRKTPARKGAKR